MYHTFGVKSENSFPKTDYLLFSPQSFIDYVLHLIPFTFKGNFLYHQMGRSVLFRLLWNHTGRCLGHVLIGCLLKVGWHGWGRSLFLLWYLTGLDNDCPNIFFSCSSALFLVLARESMLLLSFIHFMTVGISGLPGSLVASARYLRQTEKSVHSCSLGWNAPSQSPFLSPLFIAFLCLLYTY